MKLMTMRANHHYDIHGIIRIRSTHRLPELAFFKTEELLEEVDIEVRTVGNPEAHKRDDSISYQELFGNFGFSMVINRGPEKSEVFASPLIGLSPHVLYTNVVEPLLRWTFVRKGFALMHGACITFEGQAIFITARTDTGKTTTILHTMRNNVESCQFLSDDMTIFSRDGLARSYPKPLTISQHTLQAVGAAPLTFSENLFLQLQSRLHSRGGRRAGMWLSDSGFPAATLNAIVQFVIPPPKFMVDRLIPKARYAEVAELKHIVLIERGPDFEAPLEAGDMVGLLLENADDAYGFPPYPVLADELSSWEGVSLHEAERDIVTEAIEGKPGLHLSSSNYNWFERFPQLVEEPEYWPNTVSTP
jgi:hypothetical protein